MFLPYMRTLFFTQPVNEESRAALSVLLNPNNEKVDSDAESSPPKSDDVECEGEGSGPEKLSVNQTEVGSLNGLCVSDFKILSLHYSVKAIPMAENLPLKQTQHLRWKRNMQKKQTVCLQSCNVRKMKDCFLGVKLVRRMVIICLTMECSWSPTPCVQLKV